MDLYKIVTVHLLIACALGIVNGNEIDLEQLKSQLPEGIVLPPALFNASYFETMKKILQEKCLNKNGNEDAYLEIENGVHKLTECLGELVNITAVQLEIEVATPIGELDTVFHKYCLKRPDILKCVEKFDEKVKQCLDDEENGSNDTSMRIITGLLNFVCYKGGDQIALFIAEKGPECIGEKLEAIGSCVNKTIQPYVAKGVPDIKDLPKLNIGPKQCNEIQDLKSCIVDALQGCQEITPANIVESMFRFVRNETSCVDPEKSNQIAVLPNFYIIFMGIFSFIFSSLLKW